MTDSLRATAYVLKAWDTVPLGFPPWPDYAKSLGVVMPIATEMARLLRARLAEPSADSAPCICREWGYGMCKAAIHDPCEAVSAPAPGRQRQHDGLCPASQTYTGNVGSDPAVPCTCPSAAPVTAPDFAALVAAVFANEPHDMDCQVLMPRYGFSCPCTREARACAKVGRGIAAVRAEDVRHGCYSNVDDGSAYRFACHCGDWQTDSPAWEAEYHAHKDAAAARAFAEASR